MAKLSRSKQPAFDPAELEDLIFTPAVGSGVGSHLVRNPTPDPDVTTVSRPDMSTVATPVPASMATVATSSLLNMTTEGRTRPVSWITETGELVPPSRVRPIRSAPDALSAAELTVYELLWNGGAAVISGDRINQAGYDTLVRQTGFSRKTIQRVVDRLLEKEYIAIEKPADIYQRTSTVYRVFAERGILERQAARGRFHVVKIGPGFLYVHAES